MARIRPDKWETFQHYKDRDPTWIKLHKKLLDNFAFQRLPLASRALAPMLWLLASEDKDGWIDLDIEEIAFRLRVSEEEISSAIKPLIDKAFFVLDGDASGALAEPERNASPEKETETQVETQGETESLSADADGETALQAYNRIAEEFSWPLAKTLTSKRRKALRKRLGECGGISGWHAAMAKARASPFLRGEIGRDKAHETWTPDFDFFIQQESFTKLMEGKYDQRNSRQEPTGFDALGAGARGAAGVDGQGRQGVDVPDDPLGRLAGAGGPTSAAIVPINSR